MAVSKSSRPVLILPKTRLPNWYPEDTRLSAAHRSLISKSLILFSHLFIVRVQTTQIAPSFLKKMASRVSMEIHKRLLNSLLKMKSVISFTRNCRMIRWYCPLYLMLQYVSVKRLKMKPKMFTISLKLYRQILPSRPNWSRLPTAPCMAVVARLTVVPAR